MLIVILTNTFAYSVYEFQSTAMTTYIINLIEIIIIIKVKILIDLLQLFDNILYK